MIIWYKERAKTTKKRTHTAYQNNIKKKWLNNKQNYRVKNKTLLVRKKKTQNKTSAAVTSSHNIQQDSNENYRGLTLN